VERASDPKSTATEFNLITGELHMPAKRIATEVQRKKSNNIPQVSTHLKVLASGGTVLKSRIFSGPTWMRPKSVRRYKAPTVSNAHGCQSPLGSLFGQRLDHQPFWGNSPGPSTNASRASSCRWGSPRLVGVELNPGPPKGMKAKQALAQKRKKRTTQRKQKRKQDSGHATRPRVPIGGPTKSQNRISRSLTVSEDEYIADVSLSSAGFTNLQYAVNPGNGVTFPWLSTIAANFNKYKFLKLKFYYKRIASEFSGVGDVGDIVLSLNPDASDAAPLTQAQVYDLQMRDSAMPCENFALNKLSIAELNKQDSYYVRVGAVPANTDIKTYDVGVLNLSTIGTATSGICGKLFVSYTVLLHSPILVQPLLNGVAHFSTLVATSANNWAGMTLQAGATLAGIAMGVNTLTFPANVQGNYLVVYQGSAATSQGSVSITVSAGATQIFLQTASGTRDSQAQIISNAGTTTNAVFSSITVTIASSGGLLTLTPGTITTSGAGYGDIWVLPLPSSVLAVDEREHEEINELRMRADEQDRKIAALMATLSPSVTPFARVEEFGSDPPRSSEPADEFKESGSAHSTLNLISALVTRKSSSRK
jgi:hypothetical protein